MTKTVLLAFCALSALPLSADTIYTDITSTYPTGAPASVYSLGSFGVLATTFTAATSGNLGYMLLSAASTLSSTTVSLYTNSGGAPGTLLESWSLTLPGLSDPPPLTQVNSALHPALTASSQYWLVFTMPTDGQFINLGQNNTSVDGGDWSGLNTSSMMNFFASMPTPAIQLNTETPEPASFGLLCIAALLGWFRSRTLRRYRATTV